MEEDKLSHLPQNGDTSVTAKVSEDTLEGELHTPLIKRAPHLHKLEKKHSSGDLHSRLKTRKLLGVGETDDGDVHRSKLSQILGHSDQLYIRLPPGLRVWHIIMSIIISTMAIWAFVFPSHFVSAIYHMDQLETKELPVRLYGIALICLSLMFWCTINTVDKDIIRLILITSTLFFGLHAVISVLCLSLSVNLCAFPLLSMCVRLVAICVSTYFYWVISHDHWRPINKEQWKLYKQQ